MSPGTLAIVVRGGTGVGYRSGPEGDTPCVSVADRV